MKSKPSSSIALQVMELQRLPKFGQITPAKGKSTWHWRC